MRLIAYCNEILISNSNFGYQSSQIYNRFFFYLILMNGWTWCRKVALVIILTRAGLDLDPKAVNRQRITMPKIGLLPWLVEAAVVAAMSKYLLDLPWVWSLLIASIVAAVSPAVIVPCLFRLREKGYGVAKVREMSY